MTDEAGDTLTTSPVGFDIDDMSSCVITDLCAMGGTATFSLSRAYQGATYQWQYRKTEGGKWINSSVSSATEDTFTCKLTEKNQAYAFRCVITRADGNVTVADPCGFDIDTSERTVAVSTQAVSVGQKAQFEAIPSFDAASYQWQYRKTPSSKWIASSADSATTGILEYKLTSSNSAYEFRCVVTAQDGLVTISEPIGFEVEQ